MAIQFKRQESQIFIAISDCEIIETVVSPFGVRHIQVFSIETPLPIDVLAWINLLRRDDGGMRA